MLAALSVTVLVVLVNETAPPPHVVVGASGVDADEDVATLRLAGSVSVKFERVRAKPLALLSVIVSVETTFSPTLAGENASVTVGARAVTANAVGQAPVPAFAGVTAALLIEPLELTESIAVSTALAESVTVRVIVPAAPVGVTVT